MYSLTVHTCTGHQFPLRLACSPIGLSMGSSMKKAVEAIGSINVGGPEAPPLWKFASNI